MAQPCAAMSEERICWLFRSPASTWRSERPSAWRSIPAISTSSTNRWTGVEMFDDYLRRMKDRWLTPVARALGPRVSPAAITVVAFLVGLGSATAVIGGMTRVALGLWLLNRVLDGLDGTHARVHGRASRFGAYLDIVLDFVVYAAIPMAIAWRHGTLTMALAALVLVATFYVNAASWMYLAALLEQRNDGAAA